jgi:hypothetical protein
LSVFTSTCTIKTSSQAHFVSNTDASAAMTEEVVMFNKKKCRSWNDARKTHDSVSSEGKLGSVWSMLALTSAIQRNQDLTFQL